MALRELRHPFGQPWTQRAPAARQAKGDRQSSSLSQLPAPQMVGWPERSAPHVRPPQQELADIIGSGSGVALERSARAFFAEPAVRAAVDREVDAWSIAPPPPMPKA